MFDFSYIGLYMTGFVHMIGLHMIGFLYDRIIQVFK